MILLDFFSFGDESDMTGPRKIDNSQKIKEIKESFIFYNKEHHDLYVSYVL